MMDSKYLLAVNGFSPNYLAFGAQVVEDVGRYAVVRVSAQHAEWLLGRLMSGLVAGSTTIHDTVDSARCEALELS